MMMYITSQGIALVNRNCSSVGCKLYDKRDYSSFIYQGISIVSLASS